MILAYFELNPGLWQIPGDEEALNFVPKQLGYIATFGPQVSQIRLGNLT